MIPVLFKEDEQVFSHNGIGALYESLSCDIWEVENGSYALELEYPVDGEWFSELEDYRIIQAKPNDIDEPHNFRIYEIDKSIDELSVYVRANTITNDLGSNMITDFKAINLTAQQAMDGAKAKLIEPTHFELHSDIQTKSNTEWTRINPLNAIVGTRGSLVDIWGGELKRTNRGIYLYSRRGKDKVATIRPGKNLEGFNMTVSTAGIVTKILPTYTYRPVEIPKYHMVEMSDGTREKRRVANTGDTRIKEDITVLGDVVTSQYVNNYPIHHWRSVDYGDDEELRELVDEFARTRLEEAEESETIIDNSNFEQELKDFVKEELDKRAAEYFTHRNPGVDQPTVRIKVDMLQLADSPEWELFKNLERIGLTDTVEVWVEEYDIDVEVRVTELQYDSLGERVRRFEAGSDRPPRQSSIERQYQDLTKDLEDYINTIENGVNNIMRNTADGLNRRFDGYTEPPHEISEKGDIWFKQIGEGKVEIWIYDGEYWIPIMPEWFEEELEARFEEQLEQIEEAKKAADSAIEQIENDIANKFTSIDQEILDIETVSNSAQSNASQAISQATDALTQANTAITNAQESIDIANTASDNASAALNSAQQSIDTANDAKNIANNAEIYADSALTNANDARTIAIEASDTAGETRDLANNLSSQVSTFELTVDGFTQTVNDYEGQVSGFRNDVTGFQTIVAGYEVELDEYGNEVDRYATEVSTLTNTVSGFESTVATYELELIDYGKDVQGYQSQVSTLSNTVDGLTSTVAGYETELIGYRGDVTQYQNQVSTLTNTVDGFNNTVSQYTTEVNEFGNTVSTYATEVSTMRNTVSGFESTVATYGQEVNSLTGEVSTYATQVSNFSNTVNGFENTVAQYTTEVDQYGNEVGRYATEVSTLTNTVTGFESTVAEVRSDFDNMEIGGRNLLKGSQAITGVNTHSNGSYILESNVSTPFGVYDINKYTANTPSSSLIRWSNVLERGFTYTLSIYAKAVNTGKIARIQIDIADRPSEGVGSGQGNLFNVDDQWRRYEVTSTVPVGSAYSFIDLAVRNTEPVYLTFWKLERGNKATDWTPAPEDMATASQVSTLSNTVDGLNSTITQYEVELGEYGNIVSQYATQVSEFRNTVDGLTSTVASYEVEVDEFGNAVDAYATQVSTLENTVSGFQSKVTKVEQDYEGISGTVATHTSQISNLNGELALKANTTSVNALTGRVDTAETSIITNANDIKLKANTTTVNALTGRVNTAESSISANAGAIALKANQSTVDTLTGRVDSAESSITANATAIGLKASQSSVDTLTGTVNTLSGRVDVTAGQISSKVWNTDIQTAVDGIEVGGRNLLLDTDKTVSNSLYGLNTYNWARGEDIEPGEEYTVTIIGEQQSIHSGWYLNIVAINNNGYRYYPALITLTRNHKVSENKWIGTFKMPTATSYENQTILYSNPVGNYTESTVIRIKVEKGNKATDWTPAPEDTTALINHVESELTQKHDSIVASVSSIDGRVATNELNLDGLTTTVQSVQTDLEGTTTLLNTTRTTVSGHTSTIATLRTDVDGKATTTQFNTLNSTVNGTIQRVGTAEGKITQIETNVDGLQTTVASKASQSQVTQLSTSLSSVIKDVGDIDSDLTEAKSMINQNANNINLRVVKGDVIGQINLEAGRTLIQNSTILLNATNTVITGTTWMDAAVLKDASIVGAKIKDATISTAKIISLDVNKIVGNVSNFITSTWDAAYSSVNITGTSVGMIRTGATGYAFEITSAEARFDVATSIYKSLDMRANNLIFGTYMKIAANSLPGNWLYIKDRYNNNIMEIGSLIHMRTDLYMNLNSINFGGGQSITTSGNTLRLLAGTNLQMSLSSNSINTYATLTAGANFAMNLNHIYFSSSSNIYAPIDGQLQINIQGNRRALFRNADISFYNELNMRGYYVTGQSDRRLKTDIVDADIDALGAIMGWRFRNFRWIDPNYTQETQLGLIAQDTPLISTYNEQDDIWNTILNKQVMVNSIAIQQIGNELINYDNRITNVETLGESNADKIHKLQVELSKANERIKELEGRKES